MGRNTRGARLAPHKKVLLNTSSQDRECPTLKVDRQERMVVCLGKIAFQFFKVVWDRHPPKKISELYKSRKFQSILEILHGNTVSHNMLCNALVTKTPQDRFNSHATYLFPVD